MRFQEAYSDTLGTIGNMAKFLVDAGQAVRGERLAREAVAGERRVLGETHWALGNSMGKHGLALLALDRFDEAEEVMLEGHGILVAALGEGHGQSTRIVGYLAKLYDTWHESAPDAGFNAKAKEWRAKLPPTK